MDILLPGDLIGIGSAKAVAVLPVETLTPAATADLSLVAGALKSRPELHPGLRAAVSAAADAEVARLLDRVLALSRFSAPERVARWLLELHQRLLAADLATADSFPLPVTQSVIAELMGLSPVHVNRVLRQLRADGLLAFAAGRVRLLDAPRLRALAGLAPTGLPQSG